MPRSWQAWVELKQELMSMAERNPAEQQVKNPEQRIASLLAEPSPLEDILSRYSRRPLPSSGAALTARGRLENASTSPSLRGKSGSGRHSKQNTSRFPPLSPMVSPSRRPGVFSHDIDLSHETSTSYGKLKDHNTIPISEFPFPSMFRFAAQSHSCSANNCCIHSTLCDGHRL